MNNEDLEDLEDLALDVAGYVCDDRGMTDQNMIISDPKTDPIIYHVTCHTPWGPKCAGRMLFHDLAAHIDVCPHRHWAAEWGHCSPKRCH